MPKLRFPEHEMLYCPFCTLANRLTQLVVVPSLPGSAAGRLPLVAFLQGLGGHSVGVEKDLVFLARSVRKTLVAGVQRHSLELQRWRADALCRLSTGPCATR